MMHDSDRMPIIELRNLSVHHEVRGGLLQRTRGTVRALDGVNFTLYPGEVLGIAGESGSGKTTLARVIAGLQSPTTGQVRLFGQELPAPGGWDKTLRRRVQMVFQDASGFLDPRQRVVTSVMEVLEGLFQTSSSERRAEAVRILASVGLDEAAAERLPHELSGGQRQRVAIARALAAKPDLVVLDEPTSALDVSVQAQILELLMDLKQEREVTYILISHDLNVIAHLCERVAVMYLGRVVEEGAVDDLFTAPQHPYTKALLSAVPDPDPTQPWQPEVLKGEVASALNPPSGCAFHPRCAFALPICTTETPQLQHAYRTNSACHLIDQEDSL